MSHVNLMVDGVSVLLTDHPLLEQRHRLALLIDVEGLSQQQVADATNTSIRTLKGMLGGNDQLSTRFLAEAKIAFPHWNIGWVRAGIFMRSHRNKTQAPDTP